MPVRLTVNPSVTQPYILKEFEFDDFQAFFEAIKTSVSEGEKAESDLIVPVAEWQTRYREDKNVVTMARVFMVDLDSKTEQEVNEVMTHLANCGLSYLAYTSHSHLQPQKNHLACWRVIIELDREYPPEHHKQLWDWININLLLGNNDPGTRKISLAYYLPQTPPGQGHLFDCFLNPGGALDVSGVLSLGEPVPSPLNTPQASAEPAPTLTPEPAPPAHVLESVLTTWVRRGQDPERKATAQSARDLLRGRNSIPLHQGRRNGFLISLAGYLAAQFPTAAGIAQQFAGLGWEMLNGDGKYPLDHFEDMINRCQAKEQQTIQERRQQLLQERRAAISRATGGVRDHEITPEEVQGLRDLFGEDWLGHVVVGYKRDLYFLRPDGTYDPDPVHREIFFVAAKTRLAVYGDWIEYTYTNKKGETSQKTLQGFLLEYCHVAREVLFDMGQPQGGYDPVRERVYLPTATPTVEPAHSAEIQAWFDLLGEHFTDMMAALPRLTEMAPALIMTGKSATGKTLTALGVGQVYGRDPIDGESVFTQFNATVLVRQPIVFMDEKVSTAYEREGTTLIRRWVTQRSRTLDEKWQAKVELIGYPRLLVAANNANVLATRQDLSDDDHEAFAERLVHVHMDPGAAYLAAVGKPRIQSHWMNEGALPAHILWLSQHHEIRNPGARFLVRSNDTTLHESLVVRAGSAGDVAYWLLLYLEAPEKAKQLPIVYDPKRKHLRVTSQAVVQGWSYYLKEHKAPAPNVIGSSIKSMSYSNRQKITVKVAGKEKTWHAWQIDPRKLKSANDTHAVLSNFDELFDLTKPDK
jgi:hypothetical protein